MKENKADVVVVGGGIVGLAIAYHAARAGKKVSIIERTEKAQGASIRNFGLIWPIGQPAGKLLDRALRSRRTWLDVAGRSGIWINPGGSLQLAHRDDEWAVINEFYQANRSEGFELELLNPSRVSHLSPGVKSEGLIGALYSRTECTVDPREAISKLPVFLQEQYTAELFYGRAVHAIDGNIVVSGDMTWQADQVFVCSGADFEGLFPETFRNSGMIKCKLQMMRTESQELSWKLGPALCAGLTLLHYSSFKNCKTLDQLQRRVSNEMPELIKWGIHVLISQNSMGEVTIGDSHEYGLNPSPFDKNEINELILSYMHSFFEAPDLRIKEHWHGVYPKLEGQTEFIAKPTPYTTIINGLGGAGMSLSFGLAEEIIARLYSSTNDTVFA